MYLRSVLATLVTAVINGLRGELVRVEIDVAPGLPVCHIVGLPDAALSEARERVRGAIRNSGFEYPLSRITVNLAPADRRKRGAAYDLAIAVGILVASGQIRRGGNGWALLGELSLSGTVEPITGVLPMVGDARPPGLPARHRARRERGRGEARSRHRGDRRRGPGRRCAAHRRSARTKAARGKPAQPRSSCPGRGPSRAARCRPRRVLRDRRSSLSTWPTSAASSTRAGRSRWRSPAVTTCCWSARPVPARRCLARAIPGLLPPLNDDEALEVTVIESVAGLLRDGGLRRERPFRAPHHTARTPRWSVAGRLHPGEATLAHHGVLFLDELAEFDRPALDALRQPLEEGVLTIARATGRVRYPARFQLVAAMNPCRCGYHHDPDRQCRCPTGDPERYVRRVSGPLLDRH